MQVAGREEAGEGKLLMLADLIPIGESGAKPLILPERLKRRIGRIRRERGGRNRV